ncbi:MAG: hypothetical protein ACOCW3_05955 [Spirochaetota bacterium]
MRRLCTGIILAAVLVAAIPADSWYGVDGFTLSTSADIQIQPPDDESRFLEFWFRGDEEAAVAARLVERGDVLSDLDIAVIQGLSHMRAMGGGRADELESMELLPHTTGRGVQGYFLTVTSSSDWHEAFIADLGDTPGGAYGYIVVFPREPGSRGRAYLDELLEGLAVQVEDAAG